jgi:pyruvate kinase
VITEEEDSFATLPGAMATKYNDIAALLDDTLKTVGGHSRVSKTKIVCTLGPKSREVSILEKLLKAGMNVARFNFSHGTFEYHQHTLDSLRQAQHNTGIMCAVLLDTKVISYPFTSPRSFLEGQHSVGSDWVTDLYVLGQGPEIRTGQHKTGKPMKLIRGKEIWITTDYSQLGDESMISMSYPKLAEHVEPETEILCSDGTVTLKVLECDVARGMVRCRCENTTMLGEKKNVNLPGIVVDLPTITAKDTDDIMNWGVPNKIDFIAASFVRKGEDVKKIRALLGPHAKTIQIISKVTL